MTPAYVTCPTCNGTGHSRTYERADCWTCEGHGKITVERYHALVQVLRRRREELRS